MRPDRSTCELIQQGLDQLARRRKLRQRLVFRESTTTLILGSTPLAFGNGRVKLTHLGAK